MLNAQLSQTAVGQADEAQRHAYNAAFDELGLTWYWDAATYARLQTHGHGSVRVYLETEQSHLLRAYEADFLVNAIETAQARCHASMGKRLPLIPHGWSGNAQTGDKTRASLGTALQSASSAATSHRTTASALT